MAEIVQKSDKHKLSDSVLKQTQAGYITAKTEVISQDISVTNAPLDIKQSHPYSFLNTPKNKDDIGDIGHYQISETLGQGGMGFVFKAHDSQLHRTVALKVMKPELSSQPNAKARFLHEARAMASIQSDNVAIIHQVGEQNDIPYLAMEFLKGQSMEQWIKTHEKTSTETIIKWGIQICEGLIPAHKDNLIHRDIKPANLWIEAPDDRIKILDFGLAYALDSNDQLTQTGYIIGTLEYMSPEQIDSGTISAQSDLFSLGCVLYQLASKSSPFSGTSQLSVLKNLATITPLPLQQIRSDIPSSLSLLTSQLLSKSAEHRPASAEEVCLRLKKIRNEILSTANTANQSSQVRSTSKITSSNIASQYEPVSAIKKTLIALSFILLALFFFNQNKTSQTIAPESAKATDIDHSQNEIISKDTPNELSFEPNIIEPNVFEQDYFEPDHSESKAQGVEVKKYLEPIQPQAIPPWQPPPPIRGSFPPPRPPGDFRPHRPPPPPGFRPPK